MLNQIKTAKYFSSKRYLIIS